MMSLLVGLLAAVQTGRHGARAYPTLERSDMDKLPTTTKHGAVVARVSVPTCLATISAMFPDWAPAVAIGTPLAVAATEYLIGRPTRIVKAALQRGKLVDLSDEQAAAFVPMGYRFFLAARQGEYEHNLKLLAAFLTAELKAEECEPGSFLDMARRVEGLTATSLRAVALIGDWVERPNEQGEAPGRMSITAPLLISAENFASPLELSEAYDALADLMGRGFLYQSGTGYGGGDYYGTTGPFHALISRALDVAQTEARGVA